MASVNPEALGLEALLARAEMCLLKRTQSRYGGTTRVLLNREDYEMALSDIRHALALVLRAKDRNADVEQARRIVM